MRMRKATRVTREHILYRCRSSKGQKYWDGLEATRYPFEMKVAEELEEACWDFIPDYSVSVLPDAANLPVEETSIDFKSWKDSLFALIEARRAAYREWILFRRKDSESFFEQGK